MYLYLNLKTVLYIKKKSNYLISDSFYGYPNLKRIGLKMSDEIKCFDFYA